MTKPLQRARGFPDHLPKTLVKHKKIISTAFEVSRRFCFESVETPIVEQAETFQRTLEFSSIVNKEIYLLENEEKGGTLALRPEGTASIARLFITEKLEPPLRFIYSGPMFRHERPQKGRFRQFTTVAIEILGEKSERADVEAISLAWIFLKELGLHEKVSLEINTIGSLEERKAYIEKLVRYLKPLESKLSSESRIRLKKNPLRILDSKQEEDQALLKEAPSILDDLTSETLQSFQLIKKQLKACHIPFKENPRLVRGLDYYNHLVFEIKSPALGAQSAVIAGGRYDNLVETMGGPSTPAVGWGAGVERLALLCEDPPSDSPEIAVVAVGEAPQNRAFEKALFLREKGYHVYFKLTGSFSKQMGRASKKGCSIALIFGAQEVQNKTITIKNLKTEKQYTLKEEQLEKELIQVLKRLKLQDNKIS